MATSKEMPDKKEKQRYKFIIISMSYYWVATRIRYDTSPVLAVCLCISCKPIKLKIIPHL